MQKLNNEQNVLAVGKKKALSLKVLSPSKTFHVVSYLDNDDVICCFIGRGKDILKLCNFPIFLLSAFTERLGGCWYTCGCVVKIFYPYVNNT